MQVLLGFLNFACTVIIPGRAFLQRLYQATAGVTKPYHFIRLSLEMKKDLMLWAQFFKAYNGISLYRHQLFTSPDVIHIYSDSAKSLGYAAIFGNHWFSCSWPSIWWTQQNIVLLEFIPIVLALDIWGGSFKNKIVRNGLNEMKQSLLFM